MLTESGSAIYSGTLHHRRLTPKRHEFTYRLFLAYLDVDRIPELMRVSPFTSHERWNWATFDGRDHFGDPRAPLRRRLVEDAATQGLSLPEGRIYLLTQLRHFGYSFNPVSFFYCFGTGGRLEAILAEVNNTFGERHNYWLSSANELPSVHSRRYSTRKRMHVSPFMPMELDYEFFFTEPGERLAVHMRTIDGGRSSFNASLRLDRRPWSASSVHRALLTHPFMTAKVIGAIHCEALRLYLKRVPVFNHPARIRRPQRARQSR